MADRHRTAKSQRVAIYARMSTEKQNRLSPEDQITRCRDYADREGWVVIDDLVVSEAAISGATRHNRPGLLQLFSRIEEWDVLLCFDSSRLARNGEDLGWIRNRLRLHRRRAVEVATGLDLENVGAKVMGVLNEEYLAKLRLDTHRGLRGRVERNFAPGGLPYGYRAQRTDDGSRIVVVPEQADVVRRIFRLYATGSGLRMIAHELNRDRIASPRRKEWAPSAIRELLRNRLYRGEYVWNRSEWIKDHETGRRVRVDRPESEWVRQRDEAWRVVSEDEWEAVQARIARRSTRKEYSRAGGRAYARHPLSGFLECGVCGGSFHDLHAKGVYGCGWQRDRGEVICSNRLEIEREALEERVFGAVRDRVLTADNVKYVVRRALEQLREGQGRSNAEQILHRLARIEVELERAVDLGIKTGGVAAVAQKIEELKAEEAELRGRLGETPLDLPCLEDLAPLIEERVRDFRSAFDAEPTTMRRAMRALLGDERLAVRENPAGGFAVEGYLSVPLTCDTPGVTETSGRVQRLVAGGGFEPPTSGL